MNFSRPPMKTISKIWFEGDWIYGLGDDGKTYRQSLLWYNKLRKATDEQEIMRCIEKLGNEYLSIAS